MNASEHPYRKWLGINNPQPTWFELLGIPESETDLVKIKVAAKAALNMLRDPPDDETELNEWKLVRRNIRQAFHGLSDESARAIYRAGLTQSPGDRSAINTAIPEAVPLAEVLPDEPAPPHLAVADSPTGQPDSSPHTNDVLNPVTIRVDKPVRRKPGVSGAVIGVLVLAGLVLGGSWYAVQFLMRDSDRGNDRLFNASIPDAGNAGNAGKSGETQTAAPASDALDKAIRDLQAAREVDPKPVTPANDVDSDPVATPPRNPDETSSPSSGREGTDATGAALPAKPVAATVVDTSWVQPVPARLANHLAVAHHLDQAWTNIQRRNFHRATGHLDAIRKCQVTREMADAWRRMAIVLKDYRAFHKDVRQIGQSLASLEEIEIGEHRIIVTTASEDEFVFRFGQRIALPWGRLPSLLALAIYQRRHDSSSPQFRMARCLVYSIAARRNSKYLDDANTFLQQADAAQLPVADYREFVADLIDLPAGVISSFDRAAVKQHSRDLVVRYPRKPGNARHAMDQALTLRDLALSTSEPVERMALADWALTNAEGSGEPLLVGELLNLQDRLNGQRAVPMQQLLSSYRATSRVKLSDRQANDLVDCYLALARDCRQRGDERDAEKCVQRARDVCDRFQLDSRRQALIRQFDPDQAARAGQFGFD